MLTVETISAKDLERPLLQSIIHLKNSVWPGSKNFELKCNEYLYRNTIRANREIIYISSGSVCFAHAELFKRTIFCNRQAIDVGCLAGVCVSPSMQGQGLGKAVVQKAFSLVNQYYDVILFQTPVYEFYLKLGAELIFNTFYNGLIKDDYSNPWREQYIMVYPREYPWPKCDIDLNGECY